MFLTRDNLLKENSYNLGVHRFPVGHSFPMHGHKRFHEFFLVSEGCMLHTINGHELLLPPGTLQFIHPGEQHSVRCAEGSSMLKIYNCNIRSEELYNLFHFLTGGQETVLTDCPQTLFHIPSAQWQMLTDKAERIIRLDENSLKGKLLKNALCRTLVLEILLLMLSRASADHSGAPEWLTHAMQEIRKTAHYRKGLPRLIELCGRSKEHVCRTMRQYYGITPLQIVLDLRLEDAARHLAGNHAGITEVAFDCGFDNLSYFRRCFRKKFGVSPSEYRMECREK